MVSERRTPLGELSNFSMQTKANIARKHMQMGNMGSKAPPRSGKVDVMPLDSVVLDSINANSPAAKMSVNKFHFDVTSPAATSPTVCSTNMSTSPHMSDGSGSPTVRPLESIEQTHIPKPLAPVRDTKNLLDDDDGQEFIFPGHPAYQPMNISIKNTFIELPVTPERANERNTETAATCPAKYALGEEARQLWEKEQDEAEEAAQLFAGRNEEKALATVEATCSVGALLHRAELCKPCAWFHHAKGCQRGVRCEFCHECSPGEIKKRKKEKALLIRKRRAQRQSDQSRLEDQLKSKVPPQHHHHNKNRHNNNHYSLRNQSLQFSAQAQPFTPQGYSLQVQGYGGPSMPQQFVYPQPAQPHDVVPQGTCYSYQSFGGW